jgi:hypothetical protein
MGQNNLRVHERVVNHLGAYQMGVNARYAASNIFDEKHYATLNPTSGHMSPHGSSRESRRIRKSEGKSHRNIV